MSQNIFLRIWSDSVYETAAEIWLNNVVVSDAWECTKPGIDSKWQILECSPTRKQTEYEKEPPKAKCVVCANMLKKVTSDCLS